MIASRPSASRRTRTVSDPVDGRAVAGALADEAAIGAVIGIGSLMAGFAGR